MGDCHSRSLSWLLLFADEKLRFVMVQALFAGAMAQLQRSTFLSLKQEEVQVTHDGPSVRTVLSKMHVSVHSTQEST